MGPRSWLVVGMAILGVLSALMTATSGVAQNSGFVTTRDAHGKFVGQFMLNGAPFRFLGTNAYFLLDAASAGTTTATLQMLELAKSLGFTVVRTWAFMDAAGSTRAFQTSPGVFEETTARQLDWIVAQADQKGVRLILTLTNYWADYGGIPQYVGWCDRAGASRDVFYTRQSCRDLYKNWVSYLVNRTNVHTGRRYRDEPAIFAWELVNEPRSGDRTGQIVRDWIAEMAAYLKSLDPNHMVDTGEEGFDTTTAGYSAVSIYGNQTYLFDGTIGVAFTRNSADPNIDFASAHLYPEDWKFSFAAGNNWIADHIAIARGLGKPLVLGEFGVSSGAGLTEAARASVLAGWLNTFETQKGGGALFWQLLCPACRNYGDRFATVHSPDTSISNVLGPAATLASAGPAYVSSTTGTSGRRSSQ